MTEEALKPITHGELIEFLDGTGRPPECPACKQAEQGWLFHVNDHTLGQNALMTVFSFPLVTPVEPSEFLTVMAMLCIECPKCAHMEFIRLLRVYQYLKGAANG
jgi:hypothetical protein